MRVYRVIQKIALFNMFLFVLLMFIGIIRLLFLPEIIVTFEYGEIVGATIQFIAIFVGSSMIAWAILHIKYGKGTEKNKESFGMILAAIGIGIGTYIVLFDTSAAILHYASPKEYVEIEVPFCSTRLRRSKRINCGKNLFFDTPSLSPLAQSICMSEDQWSNLYEDLCIQNPDGQDEGVVTFYGIKSFYAYELQCCKESKTPADESSSTPTVIPNPSGTENIFIGYWSQTELSDNPMAMVVCGNFQNVEFYPDGTFLVTNDNSGVYDFLSPIDQQSQGTYKVLNDDEVEIKYNENDITVWKYILTGDLLSMLYPDSKALGGGFVYCYFSKASK